MKPQNTISNPFTGKALIAILGCIILSLFLSACGGGGSSSGISSSETGAVAFSVELTDRSNESSAMIPQSYGSSGVLKPAALDCGSTGIVNITAELYEAAGDHIVDAGPWVCSAHSGTMDSIPVGSNRTLKVYGKDGDGNVLYMGVKTGIDVLAGQTTGAGTVVLDTAMYLSIDYGYLQYRVYWDGVNDAYRGWVTLTKFGEPVDLGDVLTASDIVSITTFAQSKSDAIKSKIKVKDSGGTEVPISSAGFWRVPYFRADTPASSADYTGPTIESGIYMTLDAASIPVGDYTFELTTSKGDVITKSVYFPGQTLAPIVQEATMSYEWLGDDSLRLTWSDPGGSFDQFRAILLDQNYQDMLSVKLPPDVTELTIPAQVVQNITDTFGPFGARWQMQTRSYGSDDNGYARSVSNLISFSWPAVTVPNGKFDLMEYYPLSAGSMWSYEGFDALGNWSYNAYVDYTGNLKGLSNIRRYEEVPGFGLDYATYFNFDGQYIYVHGETEYDASDSDYGSTYYSPSVKLDRFLGEGETTTSSVTKFDPYGNEQTLSITFEILQHQTTCGPDGIFSDCLYIRETSDDGTETNITDLWWARGIGEVESVEIQDPGDMYLDTEYLYYDWWVEPSYIEIVGPPPIG